MAKKIPIIKIRSPKSLVASTIPSRFLNWTYAKLGLGLLFDPSYQNFILKRRPSSCSWASPWILQPHLRSCSNHGGYSCTWRRTLTVLKSMTFAIKVLRSGMMGPLAGISDPVFWFTVRPILGTYGASLAATSSGPLLLLLWMECNPYIFPMVHTKSLVTRLDLKS